MPWLKTRLVYPFFVRRLMDPSGFCVSSACVGCGKCAKACPLGNIALAGGIPAFGNHCAFCLACYHTCPHHAIGYRQHTSQKGQYLYPGQ